MFEIHQPGANIVVRDVLLLDRDSAGRPVQTDVYVIHGRFADAAAFQAASKAGVVFETISGCDCLLVPGLINAHTHSPLNILKGTGDRLSHPAFMWLNQADTMRRTPDEIRLSVLLGCIEHLRNGTTAVIDHFPEQGFDMTDVDAVVDAYRISGMRALVALRIFDKPYDDIAPPDDIRGDLEDLNPLQPRPLGESIALVTASLARHDGAANGHVTIAPAPSNPMRCSDELLEHVVAIADQHKCPVHMHLLETQAQHHIALARYGCTMVQHLDKLKLLTPRVSCAHTVWIDDEDIALLAMRGSIVVHNPASNLKLGVGVAPVSKMLQAGVTVALGTDGASTNDNLDMHEAMRLAALLHRPFEPDRNRWPSARDVHEMATVSGGIAMCCPDLGTLRIGAPADFVLHDIAQPSWLPMNDPLQQLVFSGTGRTVRSVIVAGRVLLAEGRVTAFDPDPILREVRDLVRHLRSRNAPFHHLAARLIDIV